MAIAASHAACFVDTVIKPECCACWLCQHSLFATCPTESTPGGCGSRTNGRHLLWAQDAAGNAATPGIRHVSVVCKPPTVLCSASDGSLYSSTSSGLCMQSITSIATPAPSYPVIKLIGQAVLGVLQGTSYLACPDPQPTDVICDR